MSTVSRLVVSTFASLSGAQVKALAAYAIETQIYLSSEKTASNFTFKDYNLELAEQSSLALKSIQNISTVARKVQAKYSEKIATYALNAESRDAFASFITTEATTAGFTAALTDIDNWLSGKKNNKTLAAEAKAAAAADKAAKDAALIAAKAAAAEAEAKAAAAKAAAEAIEKETIVRVSECAPEQNPRTVEQVKSDEVAAAAAAAAATAAETTPTATATAAAAEIATDLRFKAIMQSLEIVQLTEQQWTAIMDYAAMKAGFDVEVKTIQVAA